MKYNFEKLIYTEFIISSVSMKNFQLVLDTAYIVSVKVYKNTFYVEKQEAIW